MNFTLVSFFNAKDIKYSHFPEGIKGLKAFRYLNYGCSPLPLLNIIQIRKEKSRICIHTIKLQLNKLVVKCLIGGDINGVAVTLD